MIKGEKENIKKILNLSNKVNKLFEKVTFLIGKIKFNSIYTALLMGKS